jgi:hypothetical protein
VRQSELQSTRSSARLLRYILFALYGFGVVFLLRERLLTGLDPGNFLAAIESGLDVTQARPHGPGYPLFVLLWQGLNALGFSPEAAILFSNGLWIAIGLAALYELALTFTTNKAALVATIFAAISPIILFYGSTGEIYTFDLAVSNVFILAVTQVRRERLPWVWLAFGVAGGFRLSSIMFMYPAMLAATVLRKERTASLIKDHIACVCGVMLWLVPFTLHHGGLGALSSIMKGTANLPSTILQNSATYLSMLLWTLHIALPLLLLFANRIKQIRRDHLVILTIWLAAPTLFFIFKFYSKGYIIITLPVFAIFVSVIIESLSRRKQQIVASVLLIAGPALFFLMPFIPPSAELERSQALDDRLETAGMRTISWFSMTNEHLRVREGAMQEAVSMIKENVPTGDTIVLDGSVQIWAHGRALQYHLRDRHIITPAETNAVRRYGLQTFSVYDWHDVIPYNAYYMCSNDRSMEDPYMQSFTLLDRRQYFSIYRASANEVIKLVTNR